MDKNEVCSICKQQKELFDATDVQLRRSSKWTGLMPFPYTHICQQCYFKLLHDKYLGGKK